MSNEDGKLNTGDVVQLSSQSGYPFSFMVIRRFSETTAVGELYGAKDGQLLLTRIEVPLEHLNFVGPASFYFTERPSGAS